MRGVISASADDQGFVRLQIKGIGGRVFEGAEYLQPQGVFFLPPVGAETAVLAPGGSASGAVAVCASQRGASPGGASIGAGEGGLHYLGTFKAFLKADGTIALGDKVATEFVALANLVDSRLSAIKTAYDTHTHSGVTAGAGVTGPPAAPLAAPASVAATKVRAI